MPTGITPHCVPQMKCPHPIEPHQIQGLDFIHVFPVVQVPRQLLVILWLVVDG